jgi:hypothetical protein
MAEINLRKTILEYRKPTLVLDELAVVSTASQQAVEEGDLDNADFKSNNDQRKFFGRSEPLIRINNFRVTGLSYFEIGLSGFKPTIFFKFKTIDERFIFSSFPKDGDIASLYINPLGKMFKPIRMDFIINDVDSTYSRGADLNDQTDSASSQGTYITFSINAEARIPKLYKHISKAFNGNSSDALIKIAEDLDLGFSTNHLDTNDEMQWICPNESYDSFIKQIVNSAWGEENDYFDCWIDQYYGINFVNLKKQFENTDGQIETLRIPYGADRNTDYMGGTDTFEMEFPLLLTNLTTQAQSPLFITSFSLENNSGRINNELGYFQRVQFYDDSLRSDKPLNKYVEYGIESVTNEEVGSRATINKGRLGENIYREEEKKTYVGTMYYENVHQNFQQAQIQNILNRNDSYKILLRVKTRYWTPFLYRGQSIPVSIYNNGSSTISGESKYSSSGGQDSTLAPPPDQRIPNVFLSGQYVILGIDIKYTAREGMSQTLLLGKKEWALNPGIASDPDTVINNNVDIGSGDFASRADEQLGGLPNDIFDK